MDDVWKQTSVLTNAFAAISRISSFASTFVWAHGILASSIHITSVIVSCAFVNFWKKSWRFIHSHVLLLIDDLATCLFSKMIFLKLNSWTVRNIPKFKEPGLQVQMKDPLVFLHSRFLSQLWVLLVHSSISEKRE